MSDTLKNITGTLDFLVKVARVVEPLEHVHGRIKIGVSLYNLTKLLKLVGDINVDQHAQLIPGLKGYDLHPWSLSGTIFYDPEVLPSELWDDFCSIAVNPGAELSFRERVLSLMRLVQAKRLRAVNRKQRLNRNGRRNLLNFERRNQYTLT